MKIFIFLNWSIIFPFQGILSKEKQKIPQQKVVVVPQLPLTLWNVSTKTTTFLNCACIEFSIRMCYERAFRLFRLYKKWFRKKLFYNLVQRESTIFLRPLYKNWKFPIYVKLLLSFSFEDKQLLKKCDVHQCRMFLYQLNIYNLYKLGISKLFCFWCIQGVVKSLPVRQFKLF